VKLVQLTTDSNGEPSYGLDVAGNVWRLDLKRDGKGVPVFIAIGIDVIEVDDWAKDEVRFPRPDAKAWKP
jgi:hypothetical protein